MATADCLTLSDAARYIAGDAPPPWLAHALEQTAQAQLWFAQRVEAKQPGRADMRAALKVFVKASDFLLGVIGGGNMPILGHLDKARPESISFETLNSLGHGLRELRDRAEDAKNAIPVGGGPGRAWAGDSASPMVHCAMLVSETWRLVHGAPPRPGNQRAHKAARSLWCASGMVDTGWGTHRTGWRRHFEAIPRYEAERAITQRIVEWSALNRP